MALDDLDLDLARHAAPEPDAALPAPLPRGQRGVSPTLARALRGPAPVTARLLLFVGQAPSAALCELLAQDGIRSLCLAGPAQALRAAALARFDALVIDAAQLGSRAAAWLAGLRAELGCPLLVVADKADEIDEILTLELGADAYLARPLAPRRLRAHLAALLRRTAPAAVAGAVVPPPHRASGGGFELDRVANRLTAGGRCVELTEVQGALLQCLIDARGRIVPRASLAAALPRGSSLGARSVDVYIHRLRQRLAAHGLHNEASIEAVRGRGYRLGSARPIGDNAAP